MIPVHGRLPLLRLTIQRLLTRNKAHAVLCLGDSPEEEKACSDAGARFIYHVNKPIARKLNTGFQIAAEYDPDAVMYVSSSDWLSDNWLDEAGKAMTDHPMHYDLWASLTATLPMWRVMDT